MASVNCQLLDARQLAGDASPRFELLRVVSIMGVVPKPINPNNFEIEKIREAIIMA
jgi:hypothetical protein